MAIFSAPTPTAFLPAVLRNLKAWLRTPTVVASICPSFHALNERIAGSPSIAFADTIVELGPGNGETTHSLLKVMGRNSSLLAIEKTESFLESLHHLFDPRLQVCNGDAMELSRHLRDRKLEQVDVVISGIPFSSLTADDASDLMRQIYKALRPGGELIAYQFRDAVSEAAEPCFGIGQVERVWMNIPPLKIYRWVKS